MKINVIELRAIISTALIVIFLVTAVTGLALAEDEDYFFIEHSLLKDLHEYAGYVLIALVAIHFLLNLKMYLAELKSILR